MAFVVKRAGGATTSFMIGPVLDSAGAAVTTCVIGDFKISKNGAAPAALNASATLTHRHTGNYSITLTSSDRDTAGWAQVTLDKTTDSCQPLNLQVVDSAIYDTFWASGATGLPAGIATSINQNTILDTLSIRAYQAIGNTGNDTTHIHLPSELHANNELIGHTIMFQDVSAGTKHLRRIIGWVQATALAEIDSALPDTPQDNTDQYVLPMVKQFSAIQTGDTYALANGANGFANIKSETASIKAKTDNLPSDPADASDIAAAFAALNDLDATAVQTAAAAALTAYDPPTNAEMEARTLIAADYATAASIAALNDVSTADVTTSVTTALTTALTEGYRSTNATGSVRDILYEVLSVLTQASITTTTLTGYKIDGTTVAKTYTLNSATTPTSITETT